MNNKNAVIIRHATENDLSQTLEIYNEIIINTTAVYHYEPQTLKMHKQWFIEKKQKGFPIFIAEENKIILGMSTITPFRLFAAYKFTVENTIHVAAHARDRGIGKLLMLPLINAAKDLQMHAIVACIDADNIASIMLHKKFGFTEVAHFKEVGYKFERWLDLKFFELII